jgi:hypothetical protein
MNPLDNYTVAIHEASHAVAADFYGVPNYPELTPDGFSQVKQSTDPGTAGLCHLEPPFTKFQDAVISWAGFIGQCLHGTAPDWAPPFKPSEKMLRDHYMMAMHQLKKLSGADRLGILQDYRHSWRAFRSAFRIVRKNRARILRLAKAIAGRVEKPVPMPEKFPATLAEFLERIINGNDAETKLRAFIHDGAEKFLTQPQFALGPEQLPEKIETWTAARMERLRAGFTTADDWLAAARSFTAWEKIQPIKRHDETA